MGQHSKKKKKKGTDTYENRLSDQRESTVFDLSSFNKAIGADTRDTLELFKHTVMVLQCSFQDELGVVNLPSPLGSNRVGVMSPAINQLQQRASIKLSLAIPSIEFSCK